MDFPGGPVLRLQASTAGGTGMISGWGVKTLHAMLHRPPNQIIIIIIIELFNYFCDFGFYVCLPHFSCSTSAWHIVTLQ